MDSDPYDTIDLGEQLGRQHDEQYGEQNDSQYYYTQDGQYYAQQYQDLDDGQHDGQYCEQPYDHHDEDIDDDQQDEDLDDEQHDGQFYYAQQYKDMNYGQYYAQQYQDMDDDQYYAQQHQDMDDGQHDGQFYEQPYEQYDEDTDDEQQDEDLDDEQHDEDIYDEDIHGRHVDDIPMHPFIIHTKPLSYNIDLLNRGPINTFAPSTFADDRATSAESATPATPTSTISLGSPSMPATPGLSTAQPGFGSAMPVTPYSPAAAWPGTTTGRAIGWEGMSDAEISRTFAKWDAAAEQKRAAVPRQQQRDWDEMSEPMDDISWWIYLREARAMGYRRRDLEGLAYEPTPPISFLRDGYPPSSGSIHGDMDSGEVIRQRFRENLEAYVVYHGGPHWCAGELGEAEVSEDEDEELPPCKRRRLR